MTGLDASEAAHNGTYGRQADRGGSVLLGTRSDHMKEEDPSRVDCWSPPVAPNAGLNAQILSP